MIRMKSEYRVIKPKVYTWVEFTVLADGTTLLRIPDASVFPKHAAYIQSPQRHNISQHAFHSPPEKGDLVGQSDLSVIFNINAVSSDDKYDVAVNEDTNNVFDRFEKEFNGTNAVPWQTTHLLYLYSYRDSWGLIDHPMILGGIDPDGNELPEDEVRYILTESVGSWKPLSPFEVGY